MAKGGNNDKAVKAQQQANKTAERQNQLLLRRMEEQAKAAEAMALPKFQGISPQPTQTSADVQAAADDVRQRTMRRSGLNKTTYAGAK